MTTTEIGVWRHRINVTTTSKGIPSFDCTVECAGASMDEVLAESDRLVEALTARYGFNLEKAIEAEKVA